MKKLLIFAALVLGFASCQKDVDTLDVNMNQQEALITVALPEVTRADSAVGALENGVLEDHDLRFILEIYNGDNCFRYEPVISKERTAVFNVRLVPGHEYDLVVWADFVKNGEDTYYNTANGLDEIKVIDDAAMTEARDAYYGVYTLAEDKTPSSIGTITLTRPFAKVRVVTNDISECMANLGLQPTTATVSYTTDVYNVFNARTMEVASDAANTTKSIDYATSAYDETNLFVDYIFVPQTEPSVVKFDLNVTNVVNRSFNTDIAVEANKLTTITGNILTNGDDINIDIYDEFDSETIYIEGDMTLTENLVVNRPLVVREGATAVLNLNGKSIINNNKTKTFGEGEAIVVYGNLTINGEGTVQGCTRAVWARGGDATATVTINGGTYKGCEEGYTGGGNSVIYASSNNTINIYGGTFEALAADKTSYANKTEGVYAALNIADNKGYINVYGGSFKNFNPATPGTEPKAWNEAHTNGFVAEGYASVANGEWFEVLYTNGATNFDITVNNADELKSALNNNEVSTILLLEGEYGTIVAKSNKSIVGTSKAKVDVVNLNGANNLTLKNITFDAATAVLGYDGKGGAKQYANIISRDANSKTIDGAQNLVIDGCNFTGEFTNWGCCIAFTDQTRAGAGNVTIKNCVFNTSKTNATIYGHYCGNSLNGNPNFVIENNTFKSNYNNNCFPIYLGRYASNVPVVVKNNTFETISNIERAMILQDHSNYGVSYIAEGNTFAN